MEKFSNKNVDIISSMKAEILELKKRNVEFEKKMYGSFWKHGSRNITECCR